MSERPVFIAPDFMDGTTPEEIQGRMMNELPADIDDMPGGFPYDMTMPTALVASELINFHLVRGLMIAFPQYAWGEWLDLHGISAGEYRHQATYASGELEVRGQPGTEIPSGRFFSTVATSESSAVEFRSSRSVVIGDDGIVRVSVQAVLPGRGSNAGAGTVVMQNRPLDGVTSVVNPEPITGGTEIENDNDYYTRIQLRNESETLSYIGNDTDYKRWALSVDGVKECIVMQAWDGPGTVKLALVDSNGDPANEEMCAAVYDYIISPRDRSRRMLPTGTAELTVTGGTVIEVSYLCTDLDYDIEVTNMEQIKADFKAAMEVVYKRAKTLGILIYHQAESVLTDIPGVNDYGTFMINDSEDDIPLSEDEYPKTLDMQFS